MGMYIPDGAIVLLLLFVIVVATMILVSLIGKNDWQLTSLTQNTARAIVSGRANFIRFIINSENKYVDKKTHDVLPAYDKNGNKVPEAEEFFLFHLIHRHLGVWWVSLIYPIKRVHKTKIYKTRLLPEGKKGESVLKRIGRDEHPTEISDLLLSIDHPAEVREAETKDNFHIDGVFMFVLEVTNLHNSIFKFGGVKFFLLLDSAIASEANNYISKFSHDEFIKQDRGRTSGLVAAIKSLNHPRIKSPTNQLPLPFPDADDVTTDNIYDAITSLGIGEVLGVRITDVWIVGIDPDPEATKPVKAVQAATFRAKARLIDADAKRDGLSREAIGETAKTRELMAIYQNPEFVNRERIAELQGNNIQVSGIGNSPVGFILDSNRSRSKTLPKDETTEENKESTDSSADTDETDTSETPEDKE